MILSTAQSLITVFGIGTGTVAIGGLLLRDGVQWLNKSLESRRSPSVLGRVLSSRLAPRDLPADDGSYSRTWHHEVVFEYHVKGRSFRGSNTMVFKGYLSAAWHARRYVMGTDVRVLFDRADPESAVLDPRLSMWRPWFYIVAGATCIVGGVVALTKFSGG